MSAEKRQALSDARNQKKLTQSQLAELVGVTTEHVRSLEYGRVNPSLPLMFKLCQVLESTPDQLFKEDISRI